MFGRKVKKPPLVRIPRVVKSLWLKWAKSYKEVVLCFGFLEIINPDTAQNP